MSEARQALRQVLRAVDRHLTSVNGNKQWRNHIIQEFRRNSAVESPEIQKQKLRQVNDYTFLVSSVQEHKVGRSHRLLNVHGLKRSNDFSNMHQGFLITQALLLSYNIGVDREQERRKLMSDTAERVGLRMPKYAEEADPA